MQQDIVPSHSASPNREPRDNPRGTKCRRDWARLDCQGSPGNRRRSEQEQYTRSGLQRPRESGEAPPEAKRPELLRELLSTQTAIREKPSSEETTLSAHRKDVARTQQGEGRQKPTGFWLLAHLAPSMTWTWTTQETQQAVEWANVVLEPLPKTPPEYQAERAALRKPMARLQGRRIPVLLDTRAVQSIIHPAVVRQAQLQPTRKEVGVTFMGPSGEPVTTNLLIKDIAIPTGTRTYKWDAWVAPLTHPLILGYGFIKQYIKQWDVQNGRLWWRTGDSGTKDAGNTCDDKAVHKPTKQQAQNAALNGQDNYQYATGQRRAHSTSPGATRRHRPTEGQRARTRSCNEETLVAVRRTISNSLER